MISERLSEDIPPQIQNFEYGYPHSYALQQFLQNLESCKPHKAKRHPMKCDIAGYTVANC